eukprot:gene9825-20433_t
MLDSILSPLSAKIGVQYTVLKKYVPYVNLIWVMGFLAACHCYQMYFHYMSTIFDYRNTQMILSIKLTSLGWNLYDGTYDLEHINKSHPDPKINKMMTDRKKFLITSMPNLLEFYGYVYCFPCIMVGPAFEYKEYIDIITEKAFTHRKSYNKSTSTSTSTSRTNMTEQHPPSSLYAGLFSFVQGLLFLPLHLLISTNFPIHKVISTDFINSNNIFSRYLYTWIAIYGIRFKFYFAWKIAEAASTLAGFGFEGYDEQGHVKGWRGVQNVDILALETATNMQTIVRQWNKRTQGWLERYVYLRTGNSMVITYIFSALWHGFYPGFLMFFLSISYITFAERGLKRWIKVFIPSNSMASMLINFISKILPNAIFNYTTPLFFFLSFQSSLTYLKSFYFLPDISMMVAATQSDSSHDILQIRITLETLATFRHINDLYQQAKLERILSNRVEARNLYNLININD